MFEHTRRLLVGRTDVPGYYSSQQSSYDDYGSRHKFTGTDRSQLHDHQPVPVVHIYNDMDQRRETTFVQPPPSYGTPLEEFHYQQPTRDRSSNRAAPNWYEQYQPGLKPTRKIPSSHIRLLVRIRQQCVRSLLSPWLMDKAIRHRDYPHSKIPSGRPNLENMSHMVLEATPAVH